MSSTGRQRGDGLPNDRQPDDSYPTPRWVTRAGLEAFGHRLPLGPNFVWHDPCAGMGAIPMAVQEWANSNPHTPLPTPTWYLSDIRDNEAPPGVSVAARRVCDFLTAPSLGCIVIITNPPFALAEEFVRKSRKEAAYVVMLLRLSFLASKRRHGWLSYDMPDVYVLPQRPSFVRNAKGHAGVDSSEYAWFFWDSARRTTGKVHLLGLRPSSK